MLIFSGNEENDVQARLREIEEKRLQELEVAKKYNEEMRKKAELKKKEEEELAKKVKHNVRVFDTKRFCVGFACT